MANNALLDNLPQSTAIVCPQHGNVSYPQLQKLSEQFAFQLEELQVQPNDRVIICGSRSAHYIAAILGVLSVGASYVPVFEKSPASRAQVIAENSGAKVAIVDTKGQSLFQGLQFIDLDAPGNDGIERAIRMNSGLCYLLYTSGSTGAPKGVAVPRTAVEHYAHWAANHFDLTVDSNVLCTAPFYFDMSVFDVFATLLARATLVIANDKHLMFPKLLVHLIQEQKISHWKGVSSLLHYIVKMGALDGQELLSLKYVLFGGEKINNNHLAAWMELVPHARYYNAYGPTETTGVSSCYHVQSPPAASDNLPIGLARQGTEILVLNEQREPCNTNENGEIFIGGAGLSDGYWNDETKTANAFLEINGKRFYKSGDIGHYREDGNLAFVERKDNQIKVQGYRIELGEVAAGVLTQTQVSEAAAIAVESPSGEQEIAVAYTVKQHEKLDEKELRKFLMQSLPKYMQPKHVLLLDALPLTDRGKTDTALLRKRLFEKS
ncbi:amino acid adenylation domain-containing protein [Aurantivibrio plasticivorans]